MENQLKSVLYFTDDEVKEIRKYYNVSEELIKENVEILQNWIKEQKHLPQDQGLYFLERILLRNKFRIEETKKKLQNPYTLKGVRSEFQTSDNEFFIPSKELSILVPCPQLTPKQERVFYARLQNPDPDLYDFRKLISYYSMILELVMRNDYSMGDRLIFDLSTIRLGHIRKIHPFLLVKAVKFYQSVLSSRLISLDLINAPSYVSILLYILKITIPTKIYQKITIHKTIDSLAKSYTKAFLPNDFGGDLPSINSLNEQWDPVLEEHYSFLNGNQRC